MARSFSWRERWMWADSVLATTIKPEVSLSKPVHDAGAEVSADAGQVGDEGEQAR